MPQHETQPIDTRALRLALIRAEVSAARAAYAPRACDHNVLVTQLCALPDARLVRVLSAAGGAL